MIEPQGSVPLNGEASAVSDHVVGSSWCSILGDEQQPVEHPEPDYFTDLHLDQVVRAILEGFEEFRLEPFFHAPLRDVASVLYRQQVFADLCKPEVAKAVMAFCNKMSLIRHYLQLSQEVHRYQYHMESWFLEAAVVYADAVSGLSCDLARAMPTSSGMRGLLNWLRTYEQSSEFARLQVEATSIRDALRGIEFMVRINGGRVTVRRHEDRPDYSAQVLGTFSKFRQGSEDMNPIIPQEQGQVVNHVEVAMVELVARLYPKPFEALHQFYLHRRDFLDPTMVAFDREVHFYLAYLDHMAYLQAMGLAFCTPQVSRTSKEVFADDTFDIALATCLAREGRPVVTNSFHLKDSERVIVVSGPNQGGKTTFARTFGQLHHLAALGCPVPGTRAKLFLCDQLFTHFEREEDLGNLTGKLEDDLLRIRDILLQATAASVVIINEIFTSTTFDDARFLSERIMERLVELDVLCVMVSFIDELATFGPSTVSMVSNVDSHDPTKRTFKVTRRPADGLAYAFALADKYGLTYEALKATVSR